VNVVDTQMIEHTINVGGLSVRYVTAGAGNSLVLLHGLGDSATDWRWVMPSLARNYRVFAPDLPGTGSSAKPIADYSPSFFTRFVADFLDALALPSAILVGNSLGGLAALRFALAAPQHVPALVLVDSAGLGKAINHSLQLLSTPIYGDLAIGWSRTPLGSGQRVLIRSTGLFANPTRVPPEWSVNQYQLALEPGFLAATLATLRGDIEWAG